MSKTSGKPLKSNCRGNMPFALVAVVILLGASAYCAVSMAADDQKSETENIRSEINTVDKSVDSTTSFIEMGLGQIIYDVSTGADLGNLDERFRLFNELATQWLEFQFPLSEGGVTITLEEHNIRLETEKMTMSDGPDGTEGYVPSFIKAIGTVKATFESDSGSSTKILSVATDGSCALPLTLYAGSLFENAVTGGGSMLSQMINYQLTSLAQYRVINGYGSLNQFGPKGTASIITENDIRTAYYNALHALECMYFRDSSGKTYFGTTDLSKDIVGNRITVDLNSVYAQALAAQADNIIGKWFDYFLGNVVLEVIDTITDAIKDAWDAFVTFITGKKKEEKFSAEPYIREVIGSLDTRLHTGETFDFTIIDPETGEKSSLTLYYPAVSLYSSPYITDFKHNYRTNTNSIKEWITAAVNTAITAVANGKGINLASFEITDSESFANALVDAVNSTSMNSPTSFASIIKSVIRGNNIPDQFFAAIYATIEEHKNSIFVYNESTFDFYIAKQIQDEKYDPFDFASFLMTPMRIMDIYADSFTLEENREIIRNYQADVRELLDELEALNHVKDDDTSLVQKVCTGIFASGLIAIDCTSDIKRIARAMSEEYRTNISVNPLSGPIELPNTDKFVLTGDSAYVEKIDVTQYSNPSISVGNMSKKSSHETGFRESSNASYCTVIPVSIRDMLVIDLTSAGSLISKLGLKDSEYKDTLTIDVYTEISVVSGMALMGVDYQSSTNIAKDAYNLVLRTLEPIIGPLREVLHLAEEVMDKISQAIMTVRQYVNELLERLYNAIMEPLEKLYNLMTQTLNESLCKLIVDIAEKSTAIVDISAVNQKIGLTYMGYTLLFTFNLPSLEKYTKSIVKAEFSGNVSGNDISAFINIKTKGETKKTPYITGGFSIKGDKWDLSATLDPLMTTNKNFMSLSGTVKGVKIDAVLPQAVEYNEVNLALSDIPGIGTFLSNIPSPIAGTKISIDAGVSLKYDLPLETGVLINEFESNPEGTDANHEWVELINLSGAPVDLSGWTITTSKNKVHNIKGIELGMGERTVIYFEGTFLNNTKEYLILKDPDGEEIDRSTTMSDSANDSRTIQRTTDGSTKWALIEGTCGAVNHSTIFGEDGIMMGIIKEVFVKAAVKAMDEMRHVASTEELSELFKKIIQLALDDVIKRLSGCFVDGRVYVSVEFTDLADASRAGFTVYAGIDKGLVEEVLEYLLGRAESLFLGIDDPYNIKLDEVPYDNVYLGVCVYGGIKAPSFLCAGKPTDEKVEAGIDIACNLSALASVFDMDKGTPKIKAKIGIRNCPYFMIPKPLGVKKDMSYDLWFINATFTVL